MNDTIQNNVVIGAAIACAHRKPCRWRPATSRSGPRWPATGTASWALSKVGSGNDCHTGLMVMVAGEVPVKGFSIR